MPFSAPFREPNIAPIFTPGGAVIPWYLLGGVTAAQCVAAYQPKGAASLAASYINLNNPGTNDAAPGTAPSFAAATGWGFAAASTQYLKTGITPAAVSGYSTYSMIVQFSGLSGVRLGMCGCGPGWNNATNAFAIMYWQGSLRQYINGGFKSVAATESAGNYCLASREGFYNGASDGTWTGGSLTTPAEIYIGALNNAGTPAVYGTMNILSLAIYSITLSSTQVGLIAPAMAAL